VKAFEVGKWNIRPPLVKMFAAAGDREILLYRPSDRLRGGAGFYRDRTAQEIQEPVELMRQLSANPRLVALMNVAAGRGIPRELQAAARQLGVEPVESARISLRPPIPWREQEDELLLIGVRVDSAPGRSTSASPAASPAVSHV